jgi:hypothetical protein
MTDIRRQRPEVLRFKKRARELAQESNEMEDLASFWASLEDHGHPDGETCDEPDCLQAWRNYPNG